MKLRGTPATRRLKIYIQKADKLKKDLWKWKQRATSTQSELQGAQVSIKDLEETIASLKEMVNQVPIDRKAPDNTQMVLEEDTDLKTKLKEAKVQHRKYARTIACMTGDQAVQLREVEEERNNLRQDLHAAQVNNKDQQETIASLKETVNRMPLGLEAPGNTQVVLEENPADDNIQDQLENIASFNVAVNRVPLGRKAPANTQVVLKEENTFLKAELKEAKLQHRRYSRAIADMTQQAIDFNLEVTDATKDLQSERLTLRRDLRAAKVTIEGLLETASLKEPVNPMPLALEAPDNTQVVLEEKNTFLNTELHTAQLKIKDQLVLEEKDTFLQSELHTAQLKIKEQLDEGNALTQSLCRWKQRVTALTQEKTSLKRELHTAQRQIKHQLALEEEKNSLQRELHTAQHQFKDQLVVEEEKTSLQRELHTAQHQFKDQLVVEEEKNSLQMKLHTAQHQIKQQLVLEEEKNFLQGELKRAEVLNQNYERTISAMTDEHRVLFLEAQVAAQDLESGRNALQKDLQTAEANSNDQLEAIAALTQTVNQKLLELEGARLDLDQKTATIEEQNTMLEDIRREKEDEENNTFLLQATEILQQPEISNCPQGKKWYQKNPFSKLQRKTKD
ncbi:hypothetical protein EYF80_006125 [Liparis tanakae]|uniref:Uncharacterized protein n=1 Tax=Liparis tanakae TaxID=230148 RepID=A0A4Z2J0Q4_9TELE|nr:hypothetical protein EYF80_006125 [Liparis tanakae]